MRKKLLKVVAGEPRSPLIIGNIEIECYVLEDETRVLSQRGVFKGIGAARGGSKSLGGAEVPRVMASNALSAFISNNLAAALNSPIEFPTTKWRTKPRTVILLSCLLRCAMPFYAPMMLVRSRRINCILLNERTSSFVLSRRSEL